ncbi:MAG: hypothetical protein ACLSVD_02665 [Eggerthellaceae bacterium]
MKRKNLLMAVCTVLATVALAATLGGCAPSQPSGDAGNGGADAASYPLARSRPFMSPDSSTMRTSTPTSCV